ncbi:MAG: hypothetical protein EBY87_05025, partial [Actinobacteria bacterium]|nr:hypothetical protein [Actinomycetota bacterium]
MWVKKGTESSYRSQAPTSPSPTPTPAPSPTPVVNEDRPGDACSELGLAKVLNGSSLECRYSRNKKLIYVDVTNGNDAPTKVV